MKRWRLLVIVCLAAALLGVWTGTQWQSGPSLQQAVWLDTPRALPAIDIVTTDGNTVPLNAATGQWRLIFPGFTYCPDICPDTLSRLAQIAPKLAPVQVTLFSVDPQRDTPERLREYVRYFDPSFEAITPASVDTLPDMALALSVAYARVPLEGDAYTLDHSTAMPLIDPEGRLVAFFTELKDPEVFAADLQHIIESVAQGKRPRT